VFGGVLALFLTVVVLMFIKIIKKFQ
jgi:hypothetical protein